MGSKVLHCQSILDTLLLQKMYQKMQKSLYTDTPKQYLTLSALTTRRAPLLWHGLAFDLELKSAFKDLSEKNAERCDASEVILLDELHKRKKIRQMMDSMTKILKTFLRNDEHQMKARTIRKAVGHIKKEYSTHEEKDGLLLCQIKCSHMNKCFQHKVLQ